MTGLMFFLFYFIRDTCPNLCDCKGDDICAMIGMWFWCMITVVSPIYLPYLFVKLQMDEFNLKVNKLHSLDAFAVFNADFALLLGILLNSPPLINCFNCCLKCIKKP